MKRSLEITDEIADTYNNILDYFRRKHIRVTESRKAILIYMISTDCHPSAEKIYNDLNSTLPNLSLATVYNNLRVFVEEGLVTEIKVTSDNTTYFDFMGHDHINVVCEMCGKISDLKTTLPDLAQEVRKQTGYRITKSHFIMYGICSSCQDKMKESR